METETQARIAEYLEIFDSMKARVSDPAVLAILVDQIGKDRRCAFMMTGGSNGNGYANGNGDVPATEKQLGFLKRLNVDVPAGLTKEEASRLIDEAQSKA